MKVNEVKITYKKTSLGKVSNSNDVYQYLKNIPELKKKMSYQECFITVYLDNSHNILCHQIISMGSISATIVDLRLIFSTALKTLSNNIVVCHNHPSSNLKVSNQDRDLTTKVKNAGSLFEINVIDHIIVTENSYLSFMDEGIL
jgi:DNA repair protein RadC